MPYIMAWLSDTSTEDTEARDLLSTARGCGEGLLSCTDLRSSVQKKLSVLFTRLKLLYHYEDKIE